jgi:glycosyltransferase involved in cell wall biosynthesis
MGYDTNAPLSVIHVLRTPVGGLFRHVCDLAKKQSELGMQVGVFCDSTTGGQNADHILNQLKAVCHLGIHRFPIGRLPGIGDWAAVRQLRYHLKKLTPDILHGHGAKGGAYARLIGHSIGAKTFYTPHGGSLHYNPKTPTGFVFLKLEHLLSRRTDGIIFECSFSQETYRRKIGNPTCAMRVIHNGIGEQDFQPHQPVSDAHDFVFIGELRKLKGVDILLEALAKLHKTGLECSCTIVGDGPDASIFKDMSVRLGLGNSVQFSGFQPASAGFSFGRHLVIPSRAESFPYIILEGAAAGVPIITTRVGGIAEIFGNQAAQLVSPDNVDNLVQTLKFALENPIEMKNRSQILQHRVKDRFNVSTMTAATVDFYSSV